MEIAELLHRPIEQRVREFRYRCAQTLVFGIPVLALQWFGPKLGGAEAPRWIAILQAVLSGWILYVAAAGMIFEGLLRRNTNTFPDLLVGLLALALYLYSVICAFPLFIIGRIILGPLVFHWAVVVLAGWSALRWWMLSRHSRRAGNL